MKNKILSKSIVNKVNFKEQTYLRAYSINEENEQKGTFINLKVFKEVKPSVYLPFYYEESDDKELIGRLKTTDINEDKVIETEEIELFLASIDMYLEATYDVVKSSVESLMQGYEMILYKEYMGIFYVVLSDKNYSCVYEVRLDEDGKVRLLYLEKNMVDFIVRRDICRFVSCESEIYLQVSENRYFIITNISDKQCVMDVEVADNNMYNLKSVKFNSSSEDDNITLTLDTIREKFENIASFRESQKKESV